MKRKFLFPFCLVLFFLAFSLQAQTWRQFTKADGLPRDTFYTMISDRKGNVWVGMPRAISRINGGLVNDTSFDHLAQTGVRFLMESSDGSVWVPTRPALYRYGQNLEPQVFSELRWQWIYTMLESENSTIWCTSLGLYNDKNLYKFDGQIWQWVDSIEFTVSRMIGDSAGNLWLIFFHLGPTGRCHHQGL